MLTDQDIQKLTNTFASKEEFRELRSDVLDLKELVQGVIVSQDSVVKELKEMRMEYVGLMHQTNRHDWWIHSLAEQTGSVLEKDI